MGRAVVERVLEFRPDTAVAGLGQASARAGLGLHHLRYVLAAAECGGFRRAARRLGVQQSALSRRIRELEERLGAPIFARSPHGVTLTAAGQDFVRGAQGAVGDLDLAVDRAGEAGREEAAFLRIGVLAGLGGGTLHEGLRRLLAAEPEVGVELVEAEAAALAAGLSQGRLDVAFLLSSPQGLQGRPAWRERLTAALAIDDPLTAAILVGWPSLKGRRLIAPAAIASAVADLADRRLEQPSAAGLVTTATPASAARLVALGQGVAVVGEGDAARVSGVAYRPLARSFLDFWAVLGRRPEKPVLRRLMSVLPGGA